MTDFYFQRIAKYACGSTLFLDFAVQYLIESGVYEYTENSIVMVNPKTIIIPSSLEKLIKRRLNILKDDDNAIRFLTATVLLGIRVDEKTLEALDIPDWRNSMDKLASMGYMYIYNNCIYFSNYNMLKKCILEVVKPEVIIEISQILFNKVFDDSMPAPAKAYLYDLTKDSKNIILELEKLANINLSMGDFPSYLNCSEKILDALDKYASEWSQEDLDSYKTELYENVSNNLLDYDPEKFATLAENTLNSLQSNKNIDKYIQFCTKMIQGSIYYGKYMDAMKLTHKVLSLLDKYSIDPTASNFNLNFLVMSIIYVKILFYIGAFADCLDIGYNVLNVLDNARLNSISYNVITKEEFQYLVNECVGYVAIVDVLTMKEDVVEFISISRKLLSFIPQSYSVFEQLQNLIKGQKVTLSPQMDGEDFISAIIYSIVSSFVNCKDKPEEFAQQIYKAKLLAKSSKMQIFEYFTDLMIGYAYVNLENYKKASSMIYQIIKDTKEMGLNSIVHIGWYILSILYINEGKYDMAYGVLNNSDILMEKNGVVSDYLTILNKVNMYKVLMCTNSKEQAQICMTQASQLVQKHRINFNLNIDIKKLMLENSNREREEEQTRLAKHQTAQTGNVEESTINNADGEVVDPTKYFDK
jgi:predicted negative regulator of RcsB-dependent stress response